MRQALIADVQRSWLGHVISDRMGDMNLPTPNPQEVQEFQTLYKAHFGVDLTPEEALDQCGRLVKYLYLTRHALPYLRSQEQRE